MSRRPAVCLVCFCLVSLSLNTVDAKQKVPIERAEGPVDQTVYDRGLVVEDVKARDILQVPSLSCFPAQLPPPPPRSGSF